MPLPWLSNRDFEIKNPVGATIYGYKEVTDEKTKRIDRRILFKVDDVLFPDRIMSVWGQNLRTLIHKCGDDSDSWLNKKISILKETTPKGVDIKSISVI